MKENVLVLRKYTLKYCEVKGHDVQVNISSFSPLDHHILDTLTFSLPHQKDKHVPSSGPGIFRPGKLFKTTLCVCVCVCVCVCDALMEMGRGEERMEQTVGKSG